VNKKSVIAKKPTQPKQIPAAPKIVKAASFAKPKTAAV